MASSSTQLAVTLRPATAADAAALRRLAELDTRSLPPGPHLIAELWGSIEAAISLRSGELVSNPFVRTAELCELLRLHAAGITTVPEVPGTSGTRGGLRTRPIEATA